TGVGHSLSAAGTEEGEDFGLLFMIQAIDNIERFGYKRTVRFQSAWIITCCGQLVNRLSGKILVFISLLSRLLAQDGWRQDSVLNRGTGTLLLLSVALGASGCNRGTRSELSNEEVLPAFFRDVTRTSGIDHTYRNGEEANHLAILESLGGGVALFD